MNNVFHNLKNKNFHPSKKMGQNFLKDPGMINQICNNIPNLANYDCVLEIGPGLGAITEHLVNLTNKLICIELDKRLYADLKERFRNNKNIELINNDFLETDLDKLCLPYKNIIIVANIPYSITTPIVIKALSFNKIRTLYIMVQKEVADKWVYSKPANRNAATNIINYYFNVNKILTIKSTCFYPIPKVDSAMVILDRKNNEVYDQEFYKFIRPFFLAKRKKLINNLPNNFSKDEIFTFLTTLGYKDDVRAEQLTYTDWKSIYDKFKK